MRDRIAAVFRRAPSSEKPEAVEEQGASEEIFVAEPEPRFQSWSDPSPPEESDAISWIDPVAPTESRTESDVAEETDGAPVPEAPWSSTPVDEPPPVAPAVSPPEDFKFPWTRAEDAPAPVEASPGFFARLFGRKVKEVALADHPEPVAEVATVEAATESVLPTEQAAASAVPPVEEEPTAATNEYPLIEETFASVDEMPPVSDEAPPYEPPPFAPTEEPSASEPKRGLFARLFGRKVKKVARSDHPEPVAEVETVDTATESVLPTAQAEESAVLPIEAEEPTAAANEYPMVEETFGSVDEALPVSDEPPAYEPPPFAPTEEPSASEPRRGLFARLFGRQKTKQRPSLEIEIHEDRIAAAADALDEVGEQTFTDEQEQRVTFEDAFGSMEEALPSMEEALPPVEERFVPPAPPAPPARMAEARDTLELVTLPDVVDIPLSAPADKRDTIEAVRGSRDTIEVEPDPRRTLEFERDSTGDDLGDTLEVVRDKPETADAAAFFGDTLELVPESAQREPESGPYLGDTLDPEQFGGTTELEQDTDEYQVVPEPALDTTFVPPEEEEKEEDTVQVSRKTLIQRLLSWRAKAKDEEAAVAGGATVVEGNPVFLFSKFRTFYNEIIRFKHQKTEFAAGFSTAIVTDYTADISPDGAAESLSKKLAEMLELQAAEAMWMGGESAERYPEAQYAMAALADETFTHMEWEGRDAWHKNLLEVRLFKTHAADVELFRRIDKLLKDQPDSPAARDLARVYLLVIAAGFKGKYGPFGLTRALAEYRQRLYEYIHEGGDALMIYAPERRIFPEAAERTLAGHAVSRFTAAQRWAAILVFLVVGYTVVAHLAWSRVSADLKDVTDRIKAGSTTTGNGEP